MSVGEERALFLSESHEYLDLLNRGLLQLDAGTDPQVVDELFRAAHSLKGMAATLGEQAVVGLTHAMEEFFSRLRETGERLTPDDLDLLLSSCDGLEAWLVANEQGDGTEMERAARELGDLEARVRSGFAGLVARDAQEQASEAARTPPSNGLAGRKPAAGATEGAVTGRPDGPALELDLYDEEILREAARRGLGATDLLVRLHPDCRMKSVRVFLIFRNLEQVGEIVKSVPPAQALDEERFDDTFRLLVISSEPPEALAARVNGVADVREAVARRVEAPPETEAAPRAHGNGTAPPPVGAREGGPGAAREPGAVRDTFLNERSLRVDVGRLDQLVNLVGELVIQRNRLLSVAEESGLAREVVEGIDRVSTDLQAGVMALRMVPLRFIFQRFPRMVRDLARSLGRQVELEMEGEETELDRSLIHSLADPLIHLIRNAIDHGIERPAERVRRGKPAAGRLAVAARQEGNRVVIEVADDGAGIDAAAIRRRLVERGLLTQAEVDELSDRQALDWIFRPGFSTAAQVSDVSGRGVGMDVVRAAVEGAGGGLQVTSEPGRGTRVRLELPLTLAIIQALLVEVAGETLALPMDVVSEVLRTGDADIRRMRAGTVLNWRGAVLPVIALDERLRLRASNGEPPMEGLALVLERAGRSVCCLVDEVVGHQEVVIKPLSRVMRALPEVAGATVLGSGRVAVILNPETWLEG
ncbi:chemotaxis protein CheA [Limnochorda pilosa]|uniref:Chemotaxis protein CheA n=1 Tax=Limnochorda pilosa TaxID=1555112 RepID=A0A0K2SNV7_LIMPI|nr:chemotaxis protein CheA [Limnochorda pilosa]BAS28786.1 chemotaxis protein CheA [Limnochorda pilosa]